MEFGAMAIGALALLITAGVLKLRLAQFRSRMDPWHRAASVARLTDVRVGQDLGPWLKGKADKLSVQLKPYSSTYEHGTRIVIGGLGYWPGDVSLRSEERVGALERMNHKELVIGDPRFDAIAFVQGTPELVHAVLDAETRALLAGLLQGRPGQSPAVLSNQELRIDVAENEDSRSEQTRDPVTKLLPIMIGIAKRLVRPADLAGRLAHNARKDPLPAVRLANLQLLAMRHQTALVKETLRAALDDPDEEIRLTAAASLDEAGRPTLLQVALKTVSDARGARAIALLGDALPWPEAKELFERARRLGLTRTALRCIEALGRMRRKEPLELLHEIVGSDSIERALAAARAIAAIADPSSEAPLAAVLATDVPSLVVAASEALGKLGSVSVISALHEANDRRPHEPEVRRAVRQAIAEIQSRATGASPGQLSLAAGEGGQVSLAEDEEKQGHLSLPSDEAE